MTELRTLIEQEAPDITSIEAHLNALDGAQRLREVRSLGRKHLSRLFALAEGHRAISVTNIVDDQHGPMQEVVHHGKNSLGAFTEFAKVFVKPNTPEAAGKLWGYNRNSAFLETVVGPGYFVAYPHAQGEVLIDYLQTPPDKPEHWPPILSNSSRLSFFVYNGTQDVLRGVSNHVSIGRALKGGKPMSAWFILCRQD